MKKVLGLICIVFVTGTSFAWMSDSDVGSCGAQFLKIGMGARPMGMGGAAVASQDINSLYWNPAGLAALERKEFIAMYTQWFEDTSINFVGVALPAGDRTFGLSYTGLAISDFEERIEDTTDPISIFDASDMAVGISCAKQLSSVSAGWTLKAVKSTIGSDSSNVALAVDFGIIKKGMRLSGKPVTTAVVFKDFGTKIKFDNQQDPLPSSVKMGMGMDISAQLNLAADLILPRDNKANLNLGLEYMLPVPGVRFPLRMGYKTLNDFDTIDGFSAGFGLGFSSLELDFAWVPYGDFSNTYRLAISGKF